MLHVSSVNELAGYSEINQLFFQAVPKEIEKSVVSRDGIVYCGKKLPCEFRLLMAVRTVRQHAVRNANRYRRCFSGGCG